MLTKLKTTFAAILLPLALSSCGTVKEAYVECGVWLEFVFDLNMEYADSFEKHVATVDMFLFDEAGLFVRSYRVATKDLTDRKRLLIDDLKIGSYTILTVGNLAAPFGMTAADGKEFVAGTTTIEQATLALDAAQASHEFGHLYFAPPVEVRYDRDLTRHRVSLVRQTNRFNVFLQTVADNIPPGTKEGSCPPVHTVEIVAPERGAYNYLNRPALTSPLVYRPYSLLARVEYNELGVFRETSARLNTMRLIDDEHNRYRIVIREIESGKELWSHDLLKLLAGNKHTLRPDGTPLPLDEYLDRECNWDVVIAYTTEVTPPPAPTYQFVALSIRVNGWIVWQQAMDL